MLNSAGDADSIVLEGTVIPQKANAAGPGIVIAPGGRIKTAASNGRCKAFQSIASGGVVLDKAVRRSCSTKKVGTRKSVNLVA